MPEIPPQAAPAAAGGRVPVEVLDAASEHDRAHRPYGGGWTRVYVEQIRRLLDGLAAQGYVLVRETAGGRPALDAAPRASTPPYGPKTPNPGDVGSADDPTTVETPTALRERYADALAFESGAWQTNEPPWLLQGTIEKIADAVLAVRDDELERLRAEVQRMTLARNGANAMRGVHKRQADRLRTELEHAKAALAGDNEGIHQWMLTCTRVAERRREQVDHWQREAEQGEAANERAKALHPRDDSSPHGPWCGTCTTPWPCRTWTALDVPADGEQTPTPATSEETSRRG